MNQHAYCVDSQGGAINFTVNNICNVIVAPGATRSREYGQNDNGDAPNRTTNASNVPEGHPDDENELPHRTNLSNPPDIIGMPAPIALSYLDGG
ncbi:hypothetical protein CRE_11296 [Caenorhabditis remanei]|uniref:Uncharacterized protein n=1 Tax=Caenorhabditis remanei TaxID=31234 RepID=E3N0E0_CAERE|nr:hypothetical protein CRE_11296 [Caenorhabditis remanei]